MRLKPRFDPDHFEVVQTFYENDLENEFFHPASVEEEYAFDEDVPSYENGDVGHTDLEMDYPLFHHEENEPKRPNAFDRLRPFKEDTHGKFQNEDIPVYDDGDVAPPYLDKGYPLNFLHSNLKHKKRKLKPVIQHFDTSDQLLPFEEGIHFNDQPEVKPNNLNRPHNEHVFDDNVLHHFGDQNDNTFHHINKKQSPKTQVCESQTRAHICERRLSIL